MCNEPNQQQTHKMTNRISAIPESVTERESDKQKNKAIIPISEFHHNMTNPISVNLSYIQVSVTFFVLFVVVGFMGLGN